MKTLQEQIQWATEQRVAIGHFNISNLEALWGIVRSAQKVDVPVIIGVSEGERDFIGVQETRALVTSIQQSTGHPVYLNGDHTYSFERVKELVSAGYDAVIFDGSELSISDNITQTKQVVDFVKSMRPNMIVEGELGYIGKSSKLLDELPKDAHITQDTMTKPDEAKQFVMATGIDLLAPAVGNIHGMLKNAPNPNLNINLVGQLSQTTGIPMVLHGGSGVSISDFQAAIQQGMAIVHINTEIRKAWRDALAQYLFDNPDEVSPYKILASAQQAIAEVVEDKLKVFSMKN